MSEQDALIDLLNDFGGSNSYGKFDTVVFLDENGMPTDRFLQALKADRSLPSFDDTNNISANYYNGIDQSYLNDEEFEIEEKGRSGRITDHSYFDEVKSSRNVQFNQQDLPEHLPNERFISSALFSGTNNKKSKTNVTKPVKDKKKKVTKAKTSTYMNEHRNNQDISEKTTTASNLKQRSLHSTANNEHTTAINSGHASRIASNNTVEEVHFPRAVGIDTTEIEVEAESRVKSLQLRLQGQLQTIRSLESQLSEALQLVEARNKQLAHCNARLKAHSSSTTSAAAGSSGANTAVNNSNVNLRSEAAVAKATELAEQYKVSTTTIITITTLYL